MPLCSASCCNGCAGCSCPCALKRGSTPPSTPGEGPRSRYAPWEVNITESIDLNSFGEVLAAISQWGVVIEGDGGSAVESGLWGDTIDEVVSGVGDASGFTASWNESTHVVTLTVQ